MDKAIAYVRPIPPDPELDRMDKESKAYKHRLKRLALRVLNWLQR